MFSVAEFLDRAKVRANIESDYRLAKVIGKSHNVISGYRHGKSLPEESVIEQLCALSGDDPDLIAAQIQAARSKTPEARTMWLRVAARMAGHAQPAILAALFAIALIAGYASPAKAAQWVSLQKPQLESLYIVSIGRIGRAGQFLFVRLRRFPAFFWLCTLCAA